MVTLPSAPRLTRAAQLATGLLTALLALAYAGHVFLEPPDPATSASSSESAAALTPPPRVLVIGDSYAAGTGSSSPDRGVVGLMAESTGWTVSNQARGGTGYDARFASGGQEACGRAACPAFGQMLGRTAEYIEESGVISDPDMVLVIGGRNDVGRDPGAVSAAIDRFYLDVRQAFPRTRILAVGPLGDDGPVPARLKAVRADVKQAVEAVDGLYVDIGQPLNGKPELVAKDGVHPNDQGHAAIWGALRTGLRDAGVPVPDESPNG